MKGDGPEVEGEGLRALWGGEGGQLGMGGWGAWQRTLVMNQGPPKSTAFSPSTWLVSAGFIGLGVGLGLEVAHKGRAR